MTVKESIRKRKRESNLADAIKELDAELDELRSTLATALAEFEALLEESVRALPEWADVDADALRELYHTDIGDQRVLIGPRAASVAAAQIEIFVRVWVSADGEENRPDEFDAEGVASWGRELDELSSLIEAVAEGGRNAARVADEVLTQQLEDLVAGLAAARDSPEEVDPKLAALKRKLRKGKVGAALVQRESEAEVLEAQRRKTEELKAAWAPLEQLAFAGADLGAEASDRLRGLLRGATTVVVASYPELRDAAGEWVADSGPTRERKFNAPPPLPPADRAGSPSSIVDVDDAHRETAPISLSPTATAERHRWPDDDELVDVDVPIELEVPDSEVDESDPAIDLEEDEPEVVETISEESDPEVQESPRVRVDTGPARNAQDTPMAPAGATATMEVIASQRKFREPAFRLVTSWDPVALPEIALALGAPCAYVVGITAVTLAYQFGLWPDNPFEVWPWAMPMFFAFGLWAVGMPAFSGWRFEWDGAKPRPMRLSDRREGGFAEIDEKGVEIDSYTFGFRETTADLSRWREGGERGWLLVLTNDDGREAQLGCNASSKRWDDSNSECAQVEPDGVWRVSEEGLLHIADECASR